MKDKFDNVLDFLRRLERAKIYFTLLRVRDDALMIMAHVPGERWEIEYMDDGTVEVEVFRSNGEIRGEEALPEFFSRFSGN